MADIDAERDAAASSAPSAPAPAPAASSATAPAPAPAASSATAPAPAPASSATAPAGPAARGPGSFSVTASPPAGAVRVAGRTRRRSRAGEPTPHGGGATATAPAEAPEGERPSRAGRNLPAAVGVGLGLGAVIVLSLFLYRPSFAFLVGAASAYGSWELAQALGRAGARVSLPPIVVGGLATLVAAWERGSNGLVVALLLTFCGVLVWRIADGAEGFLRDVGASAFVLLYVPALASFAVLLVHPADGAARVLAFVATVVCSDTGGYATGVLFGRHPLAPVVSKGKTWEGFAGSVLTCSAAGVLFMTLTFHHAWWKGLLFGLAIVVTATVGDLGESMVKRDLGRKDMGTLLPGHGGIMDRLDSLLPCAAVAYLLLCAFAPA